MIRFLTLTLLIAGTISCTSGKKALQQGNYSQAVLQAVERLRDHPENKNALATLKEAYPLALRTLQEEIDQILKSNEPLKYGKVVERFESIQQMADEIRRCPPALRLLGDPETFPEELSAARAKAAPEAYDAGVEMLKKGNREAAKEAYYLFTEAQRFVPNYKDSAKRAAEAKMMATLKVIVEQIPVPGRYQLSSEFFYNQVFTFLREGIRNEFLEFYHPSEAKQILQPDEILVMEFYDFMVGATRDSDSEKEVTSKDSVKVGSATIDGRKVDVYDRVKAKYKQYKREVVSTGTLQVEVVDARTGKVVVQRRFPGTFTWRSEWSTFNGDERALTKEQLDATKRKPISPPPPQELFIQFTKPIFDQVKGFIRSHYRNT